MSVTLKRIKQIKRRVEVQYGLPSGEDFMPPYRPLHPHEMAKDGDEVWNFHFKAWCEWSEWSYCTHRASKNEIQVTPRLNILRTKRPSSEYEKTHPIILEVK